MCFPTRHAWTAIRSRTVDVFGDGFGNDTRYPTKTYTRILLRCDRCGNLRTRKVAGAWAGLVTAPPAPAPSDLDELRAALGVTADMLRDAWLAVRLLAAAHDEDLLHGDETIDDAYQRGLLEYDERLQTARLTGEGRAAVAAVLAARNAFTARTGEPASAADR